jgi:hypothetical protein
MKYEREREEKYGRDSEKTILQGWAGETFFPSGFEGSQAVPVLLSGRGTAERGSTLGSEKVKF